MRTCLITAKCAAATNIEKEQKNKQRSTKHYKNRK